MGPGSAVNKLELISLDKKNVIYFDMYILEGGDL